jgi:hypothetical protein
MVDLPTTTSGSAAANPPQESLAPVEGRTEERSEGLGKAFQSGREESREEDILKKEKGELLEKLDKGETQVSTSCFSQSIKFYDLILDPSFHVPNTAKPNTFLPILVRLVFNSPVVNTWVLSLFSIYIPKCISRCLLKKQIVSLVLSSTHVSNTLLYTNCLPCSFNQAFT